ncbi:MAG: cellulosome protein [Prevotella sp.]|nr:cellulosome protein [Prevotella sp.]
MKKLLTTIALSLLALMPVTLPAQRLLQKTGRAVLATNRSGSTIRSVTSSAGTGSLISWRKLAEEPEGTKYNVYKRAAGTSNYTKVNSTPLKVTCLSTTLTNNTEYAVTAISPDGTEGELSAPFLYKTQPWPNIWFKFDFDNKVLARNDYRTKFCWPMDTNGDGEYDAVVVDRLFAGASSGEENEQEENNATTSHKIQAYKLNGTLLWTVDMGPNVNICGGQNDMVVAWDINCDGRCEVMIRASDGTRFWDKQNETWGRYANGSDKADVDGDGVVDYRSHSTKVPPFYISVIDGLTGEEIACNELKYNEVTDGSDQYGRNARAKYMSFGYAVMDGHFSICYLDGIHPSLVMECLDRETNKTHHNYVFTWEYDWNGGVPTNWHHDKTWSRNDKRPWPAEFHQLRVADVDGDGTDEMIQGGYSVNPKNGWFASPGIGHGDRYILSDIDPDRPGLEAYAIQQSALLGQLLYDARTAERIKEWYLPSVYDVGRGTCLDMDNRYKGYEILSYADEFVYTCKGEKTGQTRSGSMFEGVWWDGDLQREWINSPGGSGWGTNMMVSKVLGDRLCEFSQETSWAVHGGTGTRPAFMGDIAGDWREEVILAYQNESSSTGLIGFTTNIPTNYSIYCLQQDPHYRGDCTTRGYYQHPNTGFYLGGDMPMPPLPPVFEADLRWKGGSSVESGFATFDMTQQAPYADGKSLMFDLSGDNSKPITINQSLNVPIIYMMNPRGHDYSFEGAGTTGSGKLIKSMLGTATFNCNLGHTGETIISEGTLEVNGTIAGPVELRAKGTLSGKVTLQDTITFEGALNYEGCRLLAKDDLICSKKSMTLPGNVYLEINTKTIDNGTDIEPTFLSSYLVVEGDLTFKGTNYITVNLQTKDAAIYDVARCTGTLTCDVTKLKTRGLEGINYDLVVDDNRLLLVINATRLPQENVVWTGAENNLWDYKAENFSVPSLEGDLQSPTAFVSGDGIVFTDEGQKKTITVNEMMVTNGVTFQSGKYTLNGEGGISGEGDVTVEKDADVTLNMKYSDYTGKTIVNGGKLTVPNFYDGGQKSALGAATAAKGNLQLNGGTLVLSKDNMGTDRQITLTDTATISITQSNSALSLKGQVSGTGYLVKDGAGQLNFTYGGTNSFAGLIVKKGKVAQGAWNATFGKVGSPMLLAGGEVHQIDVNSTSTVPDLNHAITVQQGTTNKIIGSSRGKISGSIKGSGNLTIQTKYVRCDISSSFVQFEGQLTAIGDGGNFRLMNNVTDMSKTKLVVGAGTTISHMSSGGGSEATATLKIGSLAGTATDGVLGGSQSTYKIGYLNTDTRFSGLLKAKSVTKEGTGKLTLATAGHTSPITVNGGTLELSNSSATVFTTGLITVAEGGTLQGNALATAVTVNKGGTITAGISGITGTLRLNGALRLNEGSTMLCKLSKTGNDKFTVKGAITHNADTLLISIPEGRTLNVGDELTIFNSGFSSATGEPIVKVYGPLAIEFDTSTLNTDGKIRVAKIYDVADVNRDGSVDVADISAVIDVMAGGTNILKAQADVNRDGTVDVADIAAVITRMAELARLFREME